MLPLLLRASSPASAKVCVCVCVLAEALSRPYRVSSLPLRVGGCSELQRSCVDVEAPQLCGQRRRHQLIILTGRRQPLADGTRSLITNMTNTHGLRIVNKRISLVVTEADIN